MAFPQISPGPFPPPDAEHSTPQVPKAKFSVWEVFEIFRHAGEKKKWRKSGRSIFGFPKKTNIESINLWVKMFLYKISIYLAKWNNISPS